MAQPLIPEILWALKFDKNRAEPYGTADFPADTTRLGLSKGIRIPLPKLGLKGEPVLKDGVAQFYETDEVRGIRVTLTNSGITKPSSDEASNVSFIWREGIVLAWTSNMTLNPQDNGVVVCAKEVTA